MEIDSAVSPSYAGIRGGGVAGRGLALRGGKERRSTLGALLAFAHFPPFLPGARPLPCRVLLRVVQRALRALRASHGLWTGIIGRDFARWGRQSSRRFYDL